MAHSGVSSMRTGIVEPAHNQYSYSSARQLITIPWDSTSATLRLYRYPMSSDVLYREQGGLPMMPAMPVEGINVGEMVLSDDIQMVLILDYYDNILSTLMWGLSDAQRWQYREFDLLNYKGWTIKVYLGTYNDGYGGNTSQHFDDVSLEVCQ
jgi:hypothetical protein